MFNESLLICITHYIRNTIFTVIIKYDKSSLETIKQAVTARDKTGFLVFLAVLIHTGLKKGHKENNSSVHTIQVQHVCILTQRNTFHHILPQSAVLHKVI